MSETSDHTGTPTVEDSDVELSERQLFQLATGQAVTVDVGDREEPRAVSLSVAAPVPLDERDTVPTAGDD